MMKPAFQSLDHQTQRLVLTVMSLCAQARGDRQAKVQGDDRETAERSPPRHPQPVGFKNPKAEGSHNSWLGGRAVLYMHCSDCTRVFQLGCCMRDWPLGATAAFPGIA